MLAYNHTLFDCSIREREGGKEEGKEGGKEGGMMDVHYSF